MKKRSKFIMSSRIIAVLQATDIGASEAAFAAMENSGAKNVMRHNNVNKTLLLVKVKFSSFV